MDHMNPIAPRIDSTFVVLDPGGAASTMNVTPTFWQDLDKRHGDFAGKVLISCYAFESDWDNWEIHPNGDEVIQLLSGDVELVLEVPGRTMRIPLQRSGTFAIVPRNTWHTFKVHKPSTLQFITFGQGTRNKPAL
jgi:uncharacterized cupin superfamily protein